MSEPESKEINLLPNAALLPEPFEVNPEVVEVAAKAARKRIEELEQSQQKGGSRPFYRRPI